MKKITLITAGICLLCSCTQTKPGEHMAVTVLVDITDPHQVYPDTKTILPLFGLEENQNNKAVFKLLPITDRKLNPEASIVLEERKNTERFNHRQDPLFRKRLIVQFCNSVKNVLSNFREEQNRADTSLHNSEVFFMIARELTLLKETKPKKGLLFIYSDLQENTELVSVYHKNKHLKQKDIEAFFEKTNLLPDDLTNSTVVVIYHAPDRVAETRFIELSQIYEKMIQKRGGKYIVSANNKTIAS